MAAGTEYSEDNSGVQFECMAAAKSFVVAVALDYNHIPVLAEPDYTNWNLVAAICPRKQFPSKNLQFNKRNA